jgi:hypothetical protein
MTQELAAAIMAQLMTRVRHHSLQACIGQPSRYDLTVVFNVQSHEVPDTLEAFAVMMRGVAKKED